MAQRYTYGTCISFGDDGEPGYCEVDVEVSYEVAWGSPETGRFGPPEDYDPGSPSIVEDIRVETVDGAKRPWGRIPAFAGGDDELAEMILAKIDRLDDDMIQHAGEIEESRRPE